MYIYRDEALKLIQELGVSIIEEIKEQNEFMFSLLEADDWSMIIKCHALIESLVTELIVTQTEEHRLKEIVERLPLSDEQIGKIRIAKDYELLTTGEITFIKRFSELRNKLVHNFENVNFSLESHVSTLDKNQKKSWKSTYTWYERGPEIKNSWADSTITNPKIAIWLSIYMFVTLNKLKISEISGKSKIRKTSETTTHQLLRNNIENPEPSFPS